MLKNETETSLAYGLFTSLTFKTVLYCSYPYDHPCPSQNRADFIWSMAFVFSMFWVWDFPCATQGKCQFLCKDWEIRTMFSVRQSWSFCISCLGLCSTNGFLYFNFLAICDILLNFSGMQQTSQIIHVPPKWVAVYLSPAISHGQNCSCTTEPLAIEFC